MRTYTQQRPVGTDAATDHFTRQQERVNNELQVYDSPTVKVEKRTRGIRLHVKPSRGGSGGDKWPPSNYPSAMSSVNAYAQGDYVYVRDTDEAVTSGVTDPDSLATVYSTPGLYRALRDVPKIPDGASFKYHIPLATLPDRSDIKSDLNFWWFLGPSLSC